MLKYSRLHEYDSLDRILKSKKSGKTARPDDNVTCSDASEDFVVFGWSSGRLTVVERNNNMATHHIQTSVAKYAIFRRSRSFTVPIDVILRVSADMLAIFLNLIVASKSTGKSYSCEECDTFSHTVISIPLHKNSRCLLLSKLHQKVVRNIHYNVLTSAIWISPNLNLIFTGDARGSVIVSKLDQTGAYKSSTLTVIPGSIADLRLGHGTDGDWLLITAGAFAKNPHMDDNSCSDLSYYLYRLSNRQLVQLDLSSQLPSELSLTVACLQPAWLYNQSSNYPPMFICTVTADSSASSCAYGYTVSQFVAAIFVVRVSDRPTNNSSVSTTYCLSDITVQLHRLVRLADSGFDTRRITVLPSIVTALLDESHSRYSSVSRGIPLDCTTSTLSHGAKFSTTSREASLSILSGNTLAIWFNKQPFGEARLNRSLFFIVQLGEISDTGCPERLPNTALSDVDLDPFTVYSQLVAYSDQLGPIRSIRPVIRRFLTSRCSAAVPFGQEIWVHRNLPAEISSDVPSLVLLSTQPLSYTRMVVSPSADISALLTDGSSSSSFGGSPANPGSSCPGSLYRVAAGEQHHQQRRQTGSGMLGAGSMSGVSSRPRGDAKLSPPSGPSSDVPAGITFYPPTFQRIESLTSMDGLTECEVTGKNDTVEVGVEAVLYGRIRAETTEGDTDIFDEGMVYICQPEEVDGSTIATLQADTTDRLAELVEKEHSRPPDRDSPSVDASTSAPDPLEPTDLASTGSSSPEEKGEGAVLPSTPGEVSSSSYPPPVPTTVDSQSGLAPRTVNGTDLDNSSSTSSSADDAAVVASEKPVVSSWSLFTLPPSPRPEKVSLCSTDDPAEIVPFVSLAGRACLAVYFMKSCRVSWVAAPSSFGLVHSLLVSPDGNLVWCLRPDGNCAGTASGSTVCSVDVLISPHGVRGLTTTWLNGEPGSWEERVLLQVTSLALGNTRALFTTSSGRLKVQWGLSPRNPYRQSFTWPCPAYHFVQVAFSTSARVIWALAAARSPQLGQDEEVQQECSSESAELCLLTAVFPGEWPSQVQDVTTSSLSNRLRSSCWQPVSLPPFLKQSLYGLLSSESMSVSHLARLVNTHLQLAFSDQLTLQQEEQQLEKVTGWLLVHPSVTAESADQQQAGGSETVFAFAYFLPNLAPGCWVDDSVWYQTSFTASSRSRFSYVTSLWALMKSVGPSSRTALGHSCKWPASPVFPQLPEAHEPTRPGVDTQQFNGALTVWKRPTWLTLYRDPLGDGGASGSATGTGTLLARSQPGVTSAYHWQQDSLLAQVFDQVACGSDLPGRQFLLYFPVPPGARDWQLWILSTASNEVYCRLSADYIRSLTLPQPATSNTLQNDSVTAVCVMSSACSHSRPPTPMSRDGAAADDTAKKQGTGRRSYHLLLGLRSGRLVSRRNITPSSPTAVASSVNPVGTAWVEEAPSLPDAQSERGSPQHHQQANTLTSLTNVPARSGQAFRTLLQWIPYQQQSHRLQAYFTSLTCLADWVWATDSRGDLLSTRLLRDWTLPIGGQTSSLLSGRWLVHTADESVKQTGGLHFICVTGASWRRHGLGNSLWALARRRRSVQAPAGRLSEAESAGDGGTQVYARCWLPHERLSDNSSCISSSGPLSAGNGEGDGVFCWLHVPAPSAARIHVTSDQVWLVADTSTRQLFARVGLSPRRQRSSGNPAVRPGPMQHEIGHAWQLVPPPDPLQPVCFLISEFLMTAPDDEDEAGDGQTTGLRFAWWAATRDRRLLLGLSTCDFFTARQAVGSPQTLFSLDMDLPAEQDVLVALES